MSRIKSTLFSGGGIRRQASLVVVGDAINLLSGLVSSMVLARIISMEVMGTYRQIMYLIPFVANVSEFSLKESVYRFWNTLDLENKANLTQITLLTSLILGAVGTVFVVVMAPILSLYYDNDALKISLWIAAPFSFLSNPYNLIRPILISKGQGLYAVLLETGLSLIASLAIIVPLLLGYSFLVALSLWIAAVSLRLMSVPLILYRYLSIRCQFWNMVLIRSVWGYLWPIQIGRFPGYVMGYMDKFVMSFMASPQQFAIYSLGAREIPFIGNIGPSVASVLIPNLVKDVQSGQYEQICRRWSLACEKTAICTYLVGMYCVWHSGLVMELMFSSTYIESGIPFKVFSALTFLRVVEYASLAKALGRSDLIMISSFAGAGTMIALAFPLVWAWGSSGMAITVLLSTLSMVVYYLSQYKVILGVPLVRFFPWKKLFLIFLAALLSTALSAWFLETRLAIYDGHTFLKLLWKLGLMFLAAVPIYLALLTFFGFAQRSLFSGLISKLRP